MTEEANDERPLPHSSIRAVPHIQVHPSTPPAPRVPRRFHRQPSIPPEFEEVEQYVLANVRAAYPPRILGEGSYGIVEELEVDGLRVAGKKIHDVLVDGSEYAQRKFVEECKTMSRLRHPHVVQFLGLWPDDRTAYSRFPMLVMEYLPYDLYNVLLSATYPNIPISMKVSFLFDVTKGLRYLHSQNYAHRDLTASNVLLNSAMVAKITDFGMTRLVDLSPAHIQRLTDVPGNYLYMPPEAMVGMGFRPDYTTKMDVFSFGVLALFTVTQQSPASLEPATYEEDGVVKARTEVERRKRYFGCARQLLADTAKPEHRLLALMENCLQHAPSRPEIGDVYAEMLWLSENVEDPYHNRNRLDFIQQLRSSGDWAAGENVQQIRLLEERLEAAGRRQDEMQRHVEDTEGRETHLRRQLDEERGRGSRVAQLEAEIEFKDRHIEQLENSLGGDPDTQTALRQTEAELLELQVQYQDSVARVVQLENDRAVLEMEWSRRLDERVQEVREEGQNLLDRHLEAAQVREGELRTARSRAEQAEEQLATKTEELRKMAEKKEALSRQLDDTQRRMEELSRAAKTQPPEVNGVVGPTLPVSTSPQRSGLRVSLPIVWNDRCPPLPFGLRHAQTVALGHKVIIGGGNADGELARRVLVYDSDRQKWGALGYYSHRHFSIAVLKQQLLLVGGFDEIHDEYTGKVSKWDQANKFWQRVDPPMPTPRGAATAVGYMRYLVVIGGFDGSALSTVEIRDWDLEASEWRTVASLPEACISPQPVLAPDGEGLYVLGRGSGLKDKKLAFSTSLAQLVQGGKGVWNQLTEPPLACSGAVGLRGYLLAIGGKDKQSQKKASVHMYLPGTGEWLCVAELPYPQHSCTCASLSPERFLIIGGVERANRLILASASTLPT